MDDLYFGLVVLVYSNSKAFLITYKTQPGSCSLLAAAGESFVGIGHLRFRFNIKGSFAARLRQLMRLTACHHNRCLATKSKQKGRLEPLGRSGFKSIEVEFAQHLRFDFPAGWVPSVEFCGSDTGFMGCRVAQAKPGTRSAYAGKGS